LDHRDHLVSLALQVHKVIRDHLESQVHRDHLVSLALQVHRDHLVSLALQVHKVIRDHLELLEPQALLDHKDHLE
jgi:hypothetical protein